MEPGSTTIFSRPAASRAQRVLSRRAGNAGPGAGVPRIARRPPRRGAGVADTAHSGVMAGQTLVDGALAPPGPGRRPGRSKRSRLLACRHGKNLDGGQNATRPPPCMRWRGPCLASPHQIGQFPGLPGAARRPPVPSTRKKYRSPGHSRVRRGCPQMVPVSNGECISTGVRECRARVRSHSFQVFSLSTRCPQKEDNYPHLGCGYPPAYAQIIHR